MSRWPIASLVVMACASKPDTSALKEVAADAVPTLVGAALVIRSVDALATVNGLAFYDGWDGNHRIIAATNNGVLAIVDAATGALVRTIGVSGTGMGELREPHGIAILGDSIALVVERGNARVQGFHLPDFTTVGTFGDRLLERPTAITAHLAGNAYAVYVTDNLKSGFARVVQFRLTVGNGELIAIHWRTFGDTSGDGAIHSSEAVGVDAEYRRLLIADNVAGASSIKVYDVDGRFSGRVLVTGRGSVGGMALYACDTRSGYWVTTLRGDSADAFHVFDRASMLRVGVLADTIARTGRALAVDARAHGRFPVGGVVAAGGDGDGRLAATSWRDIAVALHLRPDCKGR